jgi:hypothetical protein
MALALFLRLAHGVTVIGADWDTPFFYLPAEDDLLGPLEGRAHRQYGLLGPRIVPIGFSLLVRATREVSGLGSRDAAQLVTLFSGLVLLPLVYLIGRRAGGSMVGLIAAAFFAVYPDTIARSLTPLSDQPFTAMVTAAVALAVVPRRLGRREGVGVGLIAGLSCVVRSAGLATSLALLGLMLVRYRGGQASRQAIVACALAMACLIGVERGYAAVVHQRNQGFPETGQPRRALVDLGRFPDAYHVDSTGTTLRYASHETSTAKLLGGGGAFAILEASARAFLWELSLPVGLAVLAVFLGAPRRLELGALLAFGLAPVTLGVVALASPLQLGRYASPGLPVLVVLAVTGVMAVAVRWGLERRGAPFALALTLLVPMFLSPPRGCLELLSYGKGRSVREQSHQVSQQIAEHLPPRSVVALGPGGYPEPIGLSGSYCMVMPDGPSLAAVETYLRGNELRWIVCRREVAQELAKVCPGLGLEPVFEYATSEGAQVLARLDYD